MAEPTRAECIDYLEQIVFLLDNELSDGDCIAVKAHLESCSGCFTTYDEQRTVKQIVARSCSESAPEELRVKVMATLQQISIRTD